MTIVVNLEYKLQTIRLKALQCIIELPVVPVLKSKLFKLEPILTI
jgi:hypothetical protein